MVVADRREAPDRLAKPSRLESVMSRQDRNCRGRSAFLETLALETFAHLFTTATRTQP